MASLRQASQPKPANASSISNVIAAGPKRAAPRAPSSPGGQYRPCCLKT
jgi:hypothetical protein